MELLFHLENCRKVKINMDRWKDIKINCIAEINRIVTIFEVWSYEKIPYGKFKIKILESCRGGFIGIPNIAIKNLEDGTPEWISGLGNTVDEALRDAIENLMSSIETYAIWDENGMIDSAYFEWAEPHDF